MLKNRKNLRLKDYDYSQSGWYFITICTYEKQYLFGEIIGGEMSLSSLGKITKGELLNLSKHYENVELDEYWIIMPNHLHFIIKINDTVGVELAQSKSKVIEKLQINTENTVGVELAQPNAKVAGLCNKKFNETILINARTKLSANSLPVIIRSFKSGVTKVINDKLGFKQQIWQRNYYEHIIRNDRELFNIRNYIKNNPMEWANDQYNR